MFRLLLAVCLMASLSANAENWKLITDSEGGNRLIVDIDSINVEEYVKSKSPEKKGLRVYGIMRYMHPNTDTSPFAAIVDGEDCVVRKSGILINLYSNGETDKYFWSEDGVRMYDSQAIWLCAFFEALIQINEEKAQQDKNKTKPKYTM